MTTMSKLQPKMILAVRGDYARYTLPTPPWPFYFEWTRNEFSDRRPMMSYSWDWFLYLRTIALDEDEYA